MEIELSSVLGCHICRNDASFSSKQKLREHYFDIHSINLKPSFQGRPTKQITQSEEGDQYECPCCKQYFMDLNELGNHISTHMTTSDSDNNNKNQSEVTTDVVHENPQHEPITLPATLPVIDYESSKPVETKQNNKRSYEDAVLFACQKSQNKPDMKKQTLYIVDNLNVKPYYMEDEHGKEINVLAHPAAVDSSTSSLSPTSPSERKYFEIDSTKNKCGHCSTSCPISLEAVTLQSPYKNLLKTRSFVELSENICDLLNTDWRLYSNMKQVAAQLLAGGIILNQANGKAIILNTVESYGRTKLTDIHREHFGPKKQIPIRNSLPPPISIKYKNVWPTSLDYNDGKKLVIGTLSCNILVTSSLRIDKEENPVVGATMHMDLSQQSDSLSSSIYLDKESIERALNLAKDENCTSLNNCNFLGQLRQLNSFFDDGSTYFLCRCSGPLTQSHTCHPYSVFTLSDFDKGRCPASNIFSALAIDLLKKGNKAQLRKDVVFESLKNSTNENINKVLEKILLLFNADVVSILIIGNNELNKHLQNLSLLLHPYLATANKSVQCEILQNFKF